MKIAERKSYRHIAPDSMLAGKPRLLTVLAWLTKTGLSVAS
jgi:hypothetical protein